MKKKGLLHYLAVSERVARLTAMRSINLLIPIIREEIIAFAILARIFPYARPQVFVIAVALPRIEAHGRIDRIPASVSARVGTRIVQALPVFVAFAVAFQIAEAFSR